MNIRRFIFVIVFVAGVTATANAQQIYSESISTPCGTIDVSLMQITQVTFTARWSMNGKTFTYTFNASDGNWSVPYMNWVNTTLIPGIEAECEGISSAGSTVSADVRQSVEAPAAKILEMRAEPKKKGALQKQEKKAKDKEKEQEKSESKDAGSGSKESKESAVVSNNALFQFASSDLEYQTYTYKSATGANTIIRGSYSTTDPGGSLSYGGNAFLNSLSPDGGTSTTFYNVGGFVDKVFSSTINTEFKAGLTGNLLLNSDNSDFKQYSFAGFGSYRTDLGDGRLWAVGGAFDLSSISSSGGSSSTRKTLLVAGMYGMPVGEEFAVNFDAILAHIMPETGDAVNLFQIGVNGSYYFTEAFGVNAGLKKDLGIADLSTLSIVIGAGWRF